MLKLSDILTQEEIRSWIIATGRYWKLGNIKVYIDDPTNFKSFCLVASAIEETASPALLQAEVSQKLGCVAEVLVEDEIKEIFREDILKNCFLLDPFDRAAIEKHFNIPLTDISVPALKKESINSPFSILNRQLALAERIRKRANEDRSTKKNTSTVDVLFPPAKNTEGHQSLKKQKFETSERIDLVEQWLNNKDKLDKLKDVLIQLPEEQFNHINTALNLASITTKTK